MAAVVVERISMTEHDALSVLAELSSRTPSPTSGDPQLTEVPLPTNIFLLNPLALLISPPQAAQEPFFLVESEAHNCVLSISEKLNKPYEVDSLSILYSPTFKCYTSIVFYAAVFTELRRLCAAADDESGKVSPAARATIWAHLYTLIGADKPLNTSSLTPALNAMSADAEKLNLLEIEPDGPTLKQQTTKITMEFINFFRFKTALALKESLVANSKFLRPPTSSAARSSAANSVRNSAPNLLSQSDIDYISCLQMLSMLRAWAPSLERLNPAVRASIWKSCKNMPALKRYASTESSSASFSGAVASWMRAPLGCQSAISGLFSAVCLMQEAKVLSDEFRLDPSSMSKQLRELIQVLQSAPPASPSTPPTMYPSTSSPLNFSPVPPQLHGPRMVGGPGMYPMSMSPVMMSPSPPPMMMTNRPISPLVAMSSSPLHHQMTAQAMVSAMGLGFIPPPNTAIRPQTAMGVPAGFVRPQPRMAHSSHMNPVAPSPLASLDPVEANGSATKKRKLADSDATESTPAPKSPKIDESSSPRSTAQPGAGLSSVSSMNISSMIS